MTVSSEQIIKRYWAHKIDGKFVWWNERVSTLAKELGIKSSELTQLVKYPSLEPLESKCPRCGRIERQLVFMDRKAYEHAVYQRHNDCNPCAQKQREVKKEKRRIKAAKTREKRRPLVATQYSGRLLGDCPNCRTGFKVANLNNRRMRLFAGCSSCVGDYSEVPQERYSEFRQQLAGSIARKAV